MNAVEKAKALDVVASVNFHQPSGRHYVNLRGQDKGFAGDRNTKVYIKNDKLVVEEGKGTTSRGFWECLKALKAALGE